MTLPAILAAAFLSLYQDPSAFAQPQAVAEPTRLALTPTIDGQIHADEWDSFVQSNEGETFVQWEPGKLYFAGRFKTNRELVVTMDLNRDGWLVGRDNFEFRIKLEGGTAKIDARQLDATNANGPRWAHLPQLSAAAQVIGTESNGEATVEAMVLDPGTDLLHIRDKAQFRLRMDVLPQSAQTQEPFLPRVGSLVRLATGRASAMPVGLDWKVEDPGRLVTQGRSASVRFSFNSKSNPGLKRFEVKPLGVLASRAKTMRAPFPAFKNGRAFIDYEAETGREVPTGYQLVSATFFTSDGIPSMIQASIRVAPLVDISLVEDRIRLKAGSQELKIPFYIKSNSTLRLDGLYDADLPANWSTRLGNERFFVIYNSRASVRRVLTIKVPADAAGTYPIRFRSTVGDRVAEQVRWVTIVRN